MSPRRLIVVVSALVALTAAGPAGAVTNVQVAGLQVALRAQGLYRGPVDGIQGPATVAAVRAFQERKGLAVDGIAGIRTRTALGALGRPLLGRRLVARGAVGWDVSVIQFLLARHNLAPAVPDGVFGPMTEVGVRRAQARAGLLVDGVVGPATLALLGARAVATPQPARAPAFTIAASLDRWARHYGIDTRLLKALAWQESGHQAHVVSVAGAFGVMQVTPATWEYVETVLVGKPIPHTADGNVRVGAAFLAQLLKEFRGNETLALAAYYRGPAAVRRHGLGPETRRYVANVLALRGRM